MLGAAVVDADAVSHDLTRRDASGWRAVRSEFGDFYFSSDGELDRGRLRKAVFSDPSLKVRLESVLHPLIRAETTRQIEAVTSAYALLMVPLLFESGRYRARCQRVLVVDCSEDTQIRRVRARSGLSQDEVRAIINTQIGRAERLRLANDVIDNDTEIASTRTAVGRLDRLYRTLATS